MNIQSVLNLEQEPGGGAAGKDALYEMPVGKFADGQCASDVIAAALSAHDAVAIPKVPFPVLLNRPIVLSSGQRLSVHPETVLHLLPDCGGCMVRNANPFNGCLGACPDEKNDHDILIEGGVWEFAGSGVSRHDDNKAMQDFGKSTLALIDRNGKETNVAGRQGRGGALLGVLFFDNARNVTIRKVTIRQCNFYGILIAGCDHFVIEDIVFDHNKMDGVHVNGPSAYGVIQRMSGKTGDDFVALNAWDWGLSAVTFGEIHHILVQDIDCEGDEIRLLPGRKTYSDCSTTECPIHNCLFRRVHNAYCAKLYQQPNCVNEILGLQDKSEIAGEIRDVVFQDIGLDALTATGLGEVKVTALFEICADCQGLLFEDIRIGVTLDEFKLAGLKVVEVGTKSSTWKRGFTDPKMWGELFDTELVCRADDLVFKNVTFAGQPCKDLAVLAGAHRLTPNPDYPRTTPRGGTGYGILGRITIK